MTRVLVVEDERTLACYLADGLRDGAWPRASVTTGAAALEKLDVNGYEVVVLDRDLPAISGDEACRALAGRPDGPMVLLLTAAAAVEDRVDRLRLGADDYLSKPFAFAGLVLRVRALARRGRRRAAHLVRSDLAVDTLRRRVLRGGQEIGLTARGWPGSVHRQSGGPARTTAPSSWRLGRRRPAPVSP